MRRVKSLASRRKEVDRRGGEEEIELGQQLLLLRLLFGFFSVGDKFANDQENIFCCLFANTIVVGTLELRAEREKREFGNIYRSDRR